MDYTQIEQNALAWFTTRPDMRAAAVIGSQGRMGAYGADVGSDYDLLLVTTAPEAYRHTGWLTALGDVVSAVFDPYDHVAFAQSLDFFTVYSEGRNVDVSLLGLDYVQALISDPEARAADNRHLITPLFAQGIRILFDREQVFPQLMTAFAVEPTPVDSPSEALFVQLAEDFWQRAVRITKKLRAGHLYSALRMYSAQVTDLLRLVEWHARLTRSLPPSTWYRDKYLEQWADPRVVAVLPRLFPHYDSADLYASLELAMEVFRWVALETAAQLGYGYPHRSDRDITAWVHLQRTTVPGSTE